MAVPKIWRKIPQYYNLIGKSCQKCSEKYFPPRDICPECGAYPLVDFKFSGKGKIETFTIIRSPLSDPEGEHLEIYFQKTPYVLAIIKLIEGPKITAEIVDCEMDEVQIEKAVNVVFRKIMEKGKHGVIQYGYKFRLVE